MIVKLAKVVSCSSQHPLYPASNLLENRTNTSWRCAKPGELLVTVTFQLAEASCITGIDIGNYHSCVVVVTACTASEPDNWLPIVNHQFMTHDQAANGLFADQVKLFTKKELNPNNLNIKFERVTVTCMQSANLKVFFGLSFVTLRTEVMVDWGLDSFGRFKLKQKETNIVKSPVDGFQEKYRKVTDKQNPSYKDELCLKFKEGGINKFSKQQEEGRESIKRPLLEKLEAGKTDKVFGGQNKDKSPKKQETSKPDIKPVLQASCGDISLSLDTTVKNIDLETVFCRNNIQKHALSPDRVTSIDRKIEKPQICTLCDTESEDSLCKTCNKVPKPKPIPRTIKKNKVIPRKPPRVFGHLMEDVSFSLSGYVNPQRDEIRRKALQMGARYIADPNTRNKKCSHLVCAFKKTPKYQQLKGHSKIVSHSFIENCFNKKKRFSWRKYALDKSDQDEPESEEETEACTTPPRSPNPFEVDTDSDSNL